MKHELIDNTLNRTNDGIVARCVCGWVSRPCFTSLVASGLMNDHIEGATETPFKITSLTAFISVDNYGDEGIITTRYAWMPMVAADEFRLRQLRRLAEDYKIDNPDKEIKIVRFSHREDLE